MVAPKGWESVEESEGPLRWSSRTLVIGSLFAAVGCSGSDDQVEPSTPDAALSDAGSSGTDASDSSGGSAGKGGAATGGSAGKGGAATGGSAGAGGAATGGSAGAGGAATGGSAGAGGAATGGSAGAGGAGGSDAGDDASAEAGDAADGSAADGNAGAGGGAAGSDAGTGDDAGSFVPPGAQSCAGGALLCNGESCCTSLVVPGGTYYRTYSNDADGGATNLSDPATLSTFALDKYDVTVGRFRNFVAAYSGGWTPPAGAGKHVHLNGGQGLANSGTGGGHEPGWNIGDNAQVSPTNTNLACSGGTYSTWTPTAGARERWPINCVNWYEAYAFCIWDGGFLPSEAEWEYAAAGGNEQREYPWGAINPGTNNLYAIYGCYYPTMGACTGVGNIAPVGTVPQGTGRWGHLDLAGNAAQWNMDWYKAPYAGCTDCANTTLASFRVTRGGNFYDTAGMLHASSRSFNTPVNRDITIGFRCARTP